MVNNTEDRSHNIHNIITLALPLLQISTCTLNKRKTDNKTDNCVRKQDKPNQTKSKTEACEHYRDGKRDGVVEHVREWSDCLYFQAMLTKCSKKITAKMRYSPPIRCD